LGRPLYGPKQKGGCSFGNNHPFYLPWRNWAGPAGRCRSSCQFQARSPPRIPLLPIRALPALRFRLAPIVREGRGRQRGEVVRHFRNESAQLESGKPPVRYFMAAPEGSEDVAGDRAGRVALAGEVDGKPDAFLEVACPQGAEEGYGEGLRRGPAFAQSGEEYIPLRRLPTREPGPPAAFGRMGPGKGTFRPLKGSLPGTGPLTRLKGSGTVKRKRTSLRAG